LFIYNQEKIKDRTHFIIYIARLYKAHARMCMCVCNITEE